MHSPGLTPSSVNSAETLGRRHVRIGGSVCASAVLRSRNTQPHECGPESPRRSNAGPAPFLEHLLVTFFRTPGHLCSQRSARTTQAHVWRDPHPAPLRTIGAARTGVHVDATSRPGAVKTALRGRGWDARRPVRVMRGLQKHLTCAPLKTAEGTSHLDRASEAKRIPKEVLRVRRGHACSQTAAG